MSDQCLIPFGNSASATYWIVWIVHADDKKTATEMEILVIFLLKDQD